MRARYSSYVTGNIDFIEESYDPSKRRDYDPKAVSEWSKKSIWKGLEILSTQDGKETDTEGVVEFIARYHIEDQDLEHHEIATFRKDAENQRWYFVDGINPKAQPIKRETVKVGRNESCPCGSGKKYKKCCSA